jgi:beta-lactamase superfamily II metal-dependent hydrolase
MNATERGIPRVAVLDVGHGTCSILHDCDGVVVIDAGPGSSLLEYLLQQSVKRIELLLLSHADEDHIAGVLAVLASGRFDVGEVRLNSDALKDTRIWDYLRYELDRHRNIMFEPVLTSNQTGQLDKGKVRIEVLAPSPLLASSGPGGKDRRGRTISSNSISAVIRLVVDGRPELLLSGDIDPIGFDDMVEHQSDAAARVLVFPHHGGLPGHGDPRAFVQHVYRIVKPQCIIFSIGRGRHDTPRPEIMSSLEECCDDDVRILCTQLSKHCSAAEPPEYPSHLETEFARGREFRRCCAGTIILSLGDPTTLLPNMASHHRFIAASALTALCSRFLSKES